MLTCAGAPQVRLPGTRPPPCSQGCSDNDRAVVGERGGWAGPDPWLLHVGEQASGPPAVQQGEM